MMVRNSLFIRILVPLFLGLSVCWILFIFILGRASYKELYEVLDEQMMQTAQMLSVPMDYNKLPELRLSEDNYYNDEDYRIHFSIWDQKENILYADKRGEVLPSSFDENGFSKVQNKNAEYRVYTYHNNLTGLSASAGYPTSIKTEILQEVFEKFWIPWLLGLAAMVLVLFLSLWWGFKPLYRLQKEINKRNPDHLEKFSTEVPFELKNLKAELNRLIEKIRMHIDKERRFIADAAHELKTPLTAIRVQTEVLTMETQVEGQKKQTEKILQAVDRSNHLVEQLLTLSRLDEKEGLVDQKPLALENIFLSQMHDLKLLADRKNAHINIVDKQKFYLQGDEILMGVLFKNLIENALKYSSSGVQISLIVDHNGFAVSDTGPGLSEEIIQRVTERFYRPEGQEEMGSGLGLSIVAKIAELHHLAMRLESSKDGGLIVSFSKKL